MGRWRIERTLTAEARDARGWLPRGAAVPPPEEPAPVELHIEEVEAGALLLLTTPAGTFDSWPHSFNDAVEHARREFQVLPEEWRRET